MSFIGKIVWQVQCECRIIHSKIHLDFNFNLLIFVMPKAKNSVRLVETLRSVFLALVLILPAAAQTHPLDSLSESEIASAVKILRAAPNFPKAAMFSTVQLNEPPKAEVLNFKPGTSFRREAFAIVFDRERNKTFECVVDLRAVKILSDKTQAIF